MKSLWVLSREIKTTFLNFDYTKDRLDVFFSEMLETNKSYQDVWNIFKMVFLLSHGQASIERGFSVNKHLLVENYKTQSLIALRRIEDLKMSSSGKTPYNVEITRYAQTH